MQPFDDLFYLIRSLDRMERQFVLVNLSKIKREQSTHILELFKAILKMEIYDEEPLKKALNKKQKNNFAATKLHLYKKILGYLRSLHFGEQDNHKIKDQLISISILWEKGLYQQCIKMIKKTKDQAQNLESYSYLIEILLLERKWVMEKDSITLGRSLERINKDINMAIEHLNIINNLRSVRDHIFAENRKKLYQNEDSQIENLERIIHGLEKLTPEALPITAQIYYYFCYFSYYQMVGKLHESLESSLKLVSLYELNHHFMEDDPIEYKKILSNHLSILHRLSMFEVFPDVIDKIRKLPYYSIADEVSVFQNTYLKELLYYMNTGNFKKGEELVDHISDKLKKFDSIISEARKITFYYNITILYFFQEKYKKAQEWVNKIMHQKTKVDARNDLQEFVKIINLVIVYETDRENRFLDLVNSTLRQFKGTGNRFVFEVAAINLIRKIADEPAQNHFKHFEAFKKKINIAYNDIKKNKSAGMNEFICWVDHKIKKISMEQILRENINNQWNKISE